jgi:hypothetical protein
MSSNSTLVDVLAGKIESGLSLAPEVDRRQCQLLGPLAIGIQAVMGIVVLGSLLLKRQQESPKRPWRIWAADVSKQVIGQAFLHGSNLAISDLIARHSARESNPCTLCRLAPETKRQRLMCAPDFLNIMVDTTVGVLVLYLCVPRFCFRHA